MPRPIIAALFILAVSLIPATLQAQSVDDLDRDNGALGHKFGERLSAFKGLAVDNQSNDGRVKVIIDKSPKQDFFGIEISTVIYRFYNDRFYEIYLYFKDRETAEKAFAKCDARYGQLSMSGWPDSGLVKLDRGFGDDGQGFLDFISVPLNNGYRKWYFRK